MAEEHAASGLADALGRIVTGCYVLTHRDADNTDRAILLSFVQQVGFDPPRIALAIRKGRPAAEALDRAGRFVLNVCAAGDEGLVQRFGSPPAESGELFAGLETRATGAGLVIESAAAYLTGRVHEKLDAGDHWLYLADVLEGAAIGRRAPLVRTRAHGLGY